MIKLNYNLSQKKLECNYIKALFSTKFGKGKNTKSVKKKFDELKISLVLKLPHLKFIRDDITLQNSKN